MLDPAQLFNQAITALERGNRALAVDRLARVLQARPDDCEAATLLARTVREDGDLSEAERVLVAAIKAAQASGPMPYAPRASKPIDPDSIESIAPAEAPKRDPVVEAYLELADIRLALGKPGDAARALKHVLAREPNHWEAHYLLGNAFLDAGAHAEAEKAYRQAIASNPFEAEVYYNLAVVCERLGKVEEASQALAMHGRLST